MKAVLAAIADFVKSEPVIVAQLIPLVVLVAAHFGFKLSPEDAAKLVAGAEALAVLLARQNVTPVVKLPAPPPKAPGL